MLFYNGFLVYVIESDGRTYYDPKCTFDFSGNPSSCSKEGAMSRQRGKQTALHFGTEMFVSN